MDLKAELLKDHSRRQAEFVAEQIGQDKDHFKELVELMLGEDRLISQRAAWSFGVCLEHNISLITPHLKRLINALNKKHHDAVIRNIVKHLQFIDLPDPLIGIGADNCFKLLASRSQPVAVKVFCMTVLLNICKKEPDLSNELRLVISSQMNHASAGFKSRGKKTLAILESIKPT